MKYDVIIVGGGAAGSVMASRLAANAHTPCCCWKPGQIIPIRPIFRTTSNSAHAICRGSGFTPQLGLARGTITRSKGRSRGAGQSDRRWLVHQRSGHAARLSEDFDSWAALGNDEWSYDKILPYFRKSERDLDIQDECHGSDGPMPVRRRQAGPTPVIQQAFHAACLQAGFGTTNDTNGRQPAGLGVSPSNNIDGVRMSTAMTHLNPLRHYLNLTVRGACSSAKF